MLGILLPALRISLVTCALCGIAYPLAVTALGQWLLPFQANGSLEKASDGTILGSRLIGQQWTGDEWFHGRPSATIDADPHDPTKTVSAPYNAANSGASNLGPTSKALQDRLTADRKALSESQPEFANSLLPSDMLTASASGLDPDITPANASLQAARVAKARNVAPEQIAALIGEHVTPRSLEIFGEPRVNVLELNLALEKAFPKDRSTRAQRGE
jgi:potassium-transporting ATPase KdpC subunit